MIRSFCGGIVVLLLSVSAAFAAEPPIAVATQALIGTWVGTGGRAEFQVTGVASDGKLIGTFTDKQWSTKPFMGPGGAGYVGGTFNGTTVVIQTANNNTLTLTLAPDGKKLVGTFYVSGAHQDSTFVKK